MNKELTYLAGRLKTELGQDIANIQSLILEQDTGPDMIVLALPIKLYRKRREQLIDRINKASTFFGYDTVGMFADTPTLFEWRAKFLLEKSTMFGHVNFFTLLVK